MKLRKSTIDTIDLEKEVENKLSKKLKNIESFEPSGDMIGDFNKILELTERDKTYKKIDLRYSRELILKCFSALKGVWQSIIRDPETIESKSKVKQLFYVDIPEAEIQLVERAVEFYTPKDSHIERTSAHYFF